MPRQHQSKWARARSGPLEATTSATDPCPFSVIPVISFSPAIRRSLPLLGNRFLTLFRPLGRRSRQKNAGGADRKPGYRRSPNVILRHNTRVIGAPAEVDRINVTQGDRTPFPPLYHLFLTLSGLFRVRRINVLLPFSHLGSELESATSPRGLLLGCAARPVSPFAFHAVVGPLTGPLAKQSSPSLAEGSGLGLTLRLEVFVFSSS